MSQPANSMTFIFAEELQKYNCKDFASVSFIHMTKAKESFERSSGYK